MKNSPRSLRQTRASSKLDMLQAEAIRREYSTGVVSQSTLARRYGVSQTMIGHVVLGTAWNPGVVRPLKRPSYNRGEENAHAKITAGQVDQLRQQFSTGAWSQRMLARIFRLKPSTVFSMVHGISWGQNPYPLPPKKEVAPAVKEKNRRSYLRAKGLMAPAPKRDGSDPRVIANRESNRRAKLRRKGLLPPLPPKPSAKERHAAQLAYHRAFYRRHRKEQRRQFALAHPELAKARNTDHSNRRKARKLGARIVEKIDRIAIYDRDRGICWLCKRRVSRKRFTLDHMVALANGGEHAAFNLAVAHPGCNNRKKTKRVPVQLRLVVK